MREFVEGLPWWLAFVVLFLAAEARGNAIHFLGRGVRAGGDRTRLHRWLSGPATVAAERLVRRLGPPAVTLGHLTVGLQSAITATSGMLRMPQSHFQPALALGAALWAGIYTTVGFAVADTLVGLVPWWVAPLVLAVVAAAVWAVQRWLSRESAPR